MYRKPIYAMEKESNRIIITDSTKLKKIMIDYILCGMLFLVVGIITLFLMLFAVDNDGILKVLRITIPMTVIGLITIAFFALAAKYGLIYFPLKRDIKYSRKRETVLRVLNFKYVKQIFNRYGLLYIAGLKIFGTENGKNKVFYLLFDVNKDAVYDITTKVGVEYSIKYYEKSRCIYYYDDCKN